jgi:hypothetical protein
MLGSREDIPWMNSEFYRRKYYKILRWVMGSLLIMFVLLSAALYLIFFQAPQAYYANTTTGRILPMPPARTG